jgi:hypothetical protein
MPITRTIWKFTLPIEDTVDVKMPDFSKILSCGEQEGELVIWAEVIPTRDIVSRRIYIRGTGHPLTGEEGRFIGTVQFGSPQYRETYVWHLFDSKP